MSKLRILIIGSGVAGSILARRLSRLGELDVHCLEKVLPDDHSESGTGLNLGPNAIKALQLTDPDLAADLAQASLPWESWRISLANGEVLFDLPLSQVADNPGVRIRWSELYRVLRDGAGDAITYGAQISQLAPSDKDPSRLCVTWSDNGTQSQLDDIDLVIGADGRYSPTRASFSGAPEPEHVGVAIIRALVDDTSDGLIDDYEQWFNGPHRLLAFRVPPQKIYIAATFPIEKGAEIPDLWRTAEVMRRTYTPSTGEPSDKMKWLLDAMCDHLDDSHWARMQQSPVLYADPVKPVMYIGDSAHGMAPTLGQGATSAIEDACVAATLIEQQVAAGNFDVRQWLARISEVREPRIRFVMELSLEATDTMLAGSDPVEGTRWKTETPFLSNLSRLFRDVPFDAPTSAGEAS